MTVLEATAELDRLVEDTAAGLVVEGVQRFILRVQSPVWTRSWSATTHSDDDGLDPAVAFRIATVPKLVTATALLALVDQGRCALDDPTGAYLPAAILGGFRDADGRSY